MSGNDTAKTATDNKYTKMSTTPFCGEGHKRCVCEPVYTREELLIRNTKHPGEISSDY